MKPDQDKLDIIRENVDFTIALAMSDFDHDGMKVLEVGLLKGGAKDIFKHADVETLDIVEGGDHQFDLTDNSSAGAEKLKHKYDCIICTEVLEHVSNPFEAVFSLKLMMKKGGRIYVTTPFDFRIHNPLPDNWRYTEHGLRQLFKDFTILEIEGVEQERQLMPVCYRLIAEK